MTTTFYAADKSALTSHAGVWVTYADGTPAGWWIRLWPEAGEIWVSLDPSRAPPCGQYGCETCSTAVGCAEDCGGHDWSNADWPSDAEIAAAAGVGAVQFFDRGDTLADAIYRVVE